EIGPTCRGLLPPAHNLLPAGGSTLPRPFASPLQGLAHGDTDAARRETPGCARETEEQLHLDRLHPGNSRRSRAGGRPPPWPPPYGRGATPGRRHHGSACRAPALASRQEKRSGTTRKAGPWLVRRCRNRVRTVARRPGGARVHGCHSAAGQVEETA